jgi:hypothetical protein
MTFVLSSSSGDERKFKFTINNIPNYSTFEMKADANGARKVHCDSSATVNAESWYIRRAGLIGYLQQVSLNHCEHNFLSSKTETHPFLPLRSSSPSSTIFYTIRLISWSQSIFVSTTFLSPKTKPLIPSPVLTT